MSLKSWAGWAGGPVLAACLLTAGCGTGGSDDSAGVSAPAKTETGSAASPVVPAGMEVAVIDVAGMH
jgi:hypothetical protein